VAVALQCIAGSTPVRHVIPQLHHLNSLRGAFTGLGVPFEEDEEAIDTPMALGLPDPRAPAATVAAASGMPTHGQLGGPQLGINMPALAVPVAPVAVGAGAQGSSAPVPVGMSAAGGLEQPQRRPEEVVICFGIIDILQVRQFGAQVRECVGGWYVGMWVYWGVDWAGLWQEGTG
jgi:hypothetical protein